MADLLPCPFCGSGEDELGLNNEGSEWFIRCYVCHVETCVYDTRVEVEAAWNTRAQADAPAPIASAVADETEACARIAERPTYSGIGKLIAEAIRARLTPDKADGGTV